MSVESARAHLAQFGKDDAILFFQESSATVELAAHALHTQPGRIAKTLSFLAEDGPILIVCAGDARIDNRRYKDLFHQKAKMLTPQQVEEYTTHPVGGVCPFGVPEDVKIYLDESLKRFDIVYPATLPFPSPVRNWPNTALARAGWMCAKTGIGKTMKKPYKKWLLLLLSLVCLGILAFVLIQMRIWSLSRDDRVSREEAQPAQAILILGAKVDSSGNMSPALLGRMEESLALYQLGKSQTILISGDGENQQRNEIAVMKSWLLEQGVPEEDILADDHGLNTYASLYRAKHVYQLETLLVVTQNYHLGRALYLGQQLGLSCEGVGTPNSVLKAQLPQNLLRESLARVKAFFNAEVLPPDPAPLLAPGA